MPLETSGIREEIYPLVIIMSGRHSQNLFLRLRRRPLRLILSPSLDSLSMFFLQLYLFLRDLIEDRRHLGHFCAMEFRFLFIRPWIMLTVSRLELLKTQVP